METQIGEGRQYACSTRDEITDMKSFLRDHIACEIEDNRDGHIHNVPCVAPLLVITVDDYEPAADEQWDVDQWESRQGFIYATATRANWKHCFRIARIFANGNKLRAPDGSILELPCIVTLTMNMN